MKTEYQYFPNRVTIVAANLDDPESAALEMYLNFSTGFGRSHRVGQLALALLLGKRLLWHTSMGEQKMKNKNPTRLVLGEKHIMLVLLSFLVSVRFGFRYHKISFSDSQKNFNIFQTLSQRNDAKYIKIWVSEICPFK